MSAALRSTVLVYSGGACGVTGAAAGGAICGAVCGATPKASIAFGCWVKRHGNSNKYLVQFIQSKTNMFHAVKSSDFLLPAAKVYAQIVRGTNQDQFDMVLNPVNRDAAISLDARHLL